MYYRSAQQICVRTTTNEITVLRKLSEAEKGMIDCEFTMGIPSSIDNNRHILHNKNWKLLKKKSVVLHKNIQNVLQQQAIICLKKRVNKIAVTV